MSTGDEIKPPRKKPSIFWWLGGAFILLIFVFGYQLFGPSPRIVVSPQTTHITSPLGADGLPDYEKFILERMREGVTPENNAATLIWPALWPAELDPADYAAVAAELGLAGEPSESESLKQLTERIAKIAADQVPKVTTANDPANADPDVIHAAQTMLDEYRDTLAEKVEEQVTSCPWTSEQHPILAKWVDENERPLDQCVEASTRTRCYFPSPTLLDDKHDPLIGMLLPGIQAVRTAGRALSARAMWHAGEHRPQEAWRDLFAMHRIGHLTAQDPSIVGELVGISISDMACHRTAIMLHECAPSPDLVRQIQRDLDSLTQFNKMAENMDGLERLSFLNIAVEISRGTFDADYFEFLGLSDQVNLLQRVNINWNAVLSTGNDWSDRLVVAMKSTNLAARQKALSELDDEISAMSRERSAGTFAAAAMNPSARSKLIAAQLIGHLFPTFQTGVAAEDRANLNLELTRVAAALAIFRSESKAYPATLNEFIPKILAQLPIDVYGRPFIYRRVEDGYLLYSTGLNGIDDGGSNESYRIVEGLSVDSLDETASAAATAKMPKDADDFAIRVPRPPVQLPKPPSATEQ